MKKLLSAFFVLSLFSGCLKSDPPVFTCSYNPCSVVAPATEVQEVEAYLAANSITATKHCSGLYYQIIQDGTGATPTVCSNIAFTYEGRLTNGTVFDKADSPQWFRLADLITGFKNGIPLIKTGGKMKLYVPPSLGYGNRQAGSIPPNSILIFDVGLEGVQ